LLATKYFNCQQHKITIVNDQKRVLVTFHMATQKWVSVAIREKLIIGW
jgi:predicted DNA-binding protein (MmcQ/YjbR family)